LIKEYIEEGATTQQAIQAAKEELECSASLMPLAARGRKFDYPIKRGKRKDEII
jgi:hypothetical protein